MMATLSSNGDSEVNDDDNVLPANDDDSDHEISDALRKHREMIREMKQRYRVSIIQQNARHYHKSIANNSGCNDIIIKHPPTDKTKIWLRQTGSLLNRRHKLSLVHRQRLETTEKELSWRKEEFVRKISPYDDEDFCRLFSKNRRSSKYETGIVKDIDDNIRRAEMVNDGPSDRFFDSFEVLVDEEELFVDEFFDCVPISPQSVKNIEGETIGNITSLPSITKDNEEDECEEFIDSFDEEDEFEDFVDNFDEEDHCEDFVDSISEPLSLSTQALKPRFSLAINDSVLVQNLNRTKIEKCLVIRVPDLEGNNSPKKSPSEISFAKEASSTNDDSHVIFLTSNGNRDAMSPSEVKQGRLDLTKSPSTKEAFNKYDNSHAIAVTDDVVCEEYASLPKLEKERFELEAGDILDPTILPENDREKFSCILDNCFGKLDLMNNNDDLHSASENISSHDRSFYTSDEKNCMKFDNSSEYEVSPRELINGLSIEEELNQVEVVNDEKMMMEPIRGGDQVTERVSTVSLEEPTQASCDMEFSLSPIPRNDEQEEIDKILTDFLLTMDSLDDDNDNDVDDRSIETDIVSSTECLSENSYGTLEAERSVTSSSREETIPYICQNIQEESGADKDKDTNSRSSIDVESDPRSDVYNIETKEFPEINSGFMNILSQQSQRTISISEIVSESDQNFKTPEEEPNVNKDFDSRSSIDALSDSIIDVHNLKMQEFLELNSNVNSRPSIDADADSRSDVNTIERKKKSEINSDAYSSLINDADSESDVHNMEPHEILETNSELMMHKHQLYGISQRIQGNKLDFSSKKSEDIKSPYINESPIQSSLRTGDNQSDFTFPIRSVVDNEARQFKYTLQTELLLENEILKSKIKTDRKLLSFTPLNESKSRITSPDLNQSTNSSGIFLSASIEIDFRRPHDPVAKALSRDSSDNKESIGEGVQAIPCEVKNFEGELISTIESSQLQILNNGPFYEEFDLAAKALFRDSSDDNEVIKDIHDIPCEATHCAIPLHDLNHESTHESTHEDYDFIANVLPGDSLENEEAIDGIQDISTKRTEFETKLISVAANDHPQELYHKSTHNDLRTESDENSDRKLPSFEHDLMSIMNASPIQLKESEKNDCCTSPVSRLEFPALNTNSDEAVKSIGCSRVIRKQCEDHNKVIPISTPPPVSKSYKKLSEISMPKQSKIPRTTTPVRSNPSSIPFYRTRERLNESRRKQHHTPKSPHKVETSRSSFYGEGGSIWYGSPGRSITGSSSVPCNNRCLDISSFRNGDNKSNKSTNNVEPSESPLCGERSSNANSPDRSDILTPLRRFHSLASPPVSPAISLFSRMPHGARSVIRRLEKRAQVLDDDLLSVNTIRVCTNKFVYNLHPKKGPCNRCWSLAGFEELEQYKSRGRHLSISTTKGGCDRSCTIFPPIDNNDVPVRLCRQCFFATHQDENGCKVQVYRGNHIKVQCNI